MGVSFFTVFEGVDLAATEASKLRGESLGPAVEVSFPDSSWDRVTYFKPFPTQDAAKEAAKGLTAELKPLLPKGRSGFFSTDRMNLKYADLVALRAKVEATVKEWADDDAKILSVN